MRPTTVDSGTLLSAQAREARGLLEGCLARAGWPWRPGLSRWVDTLIVLEERDAAGPTRDA